MSEKNQKLVEEISQKMRRILKKRNWIMKCWKIPKYLVFSHNNIGTCFKTVILKFNILTWVLWMFFQTNFFVLIFWKTKNVFWTCKKSLLCISLVKRDLVQSFSSKVRSILVRSNVIVARTLYSLSWGLRFKITRWLYDRIILLSYQGQSIEY